MARRTADLPPAPRSHRLDAARRRAQGGRPVAVGPHRRRRVPDQPADGAQGLPGTGRRRARRVAPRARHVRQRRRAESAAQRRAREISGRRVAADSQAHRTARPQDGRPLMTYIEAHGLRKTYGAHVALDRIDLQIGEDAIVGLTSYEGTLRVLGRDPWNEREDLMRDVSFITDVAVLPRWIRVAQAL